MNADTLADNLSFNFINSSDNKCIVNEFCMLFEQRCKDKLSINFNVDTIEFALHKLKNSNALDIDDLGEKSSRNSSQYFSGFKTLV